MEKLRIALLLLLALNCGKKAPPPSPDRWAPRLTSAEAVNRRHVKVVFSEDVDPRTSLEISNYNCFESETDRPLPVLAATARNRNEVDLTTSIQSPSSYTLEVTGIKDASGNQMSLQRVQFDGSVARDPHPPKVARIHPADGSVDFDPDSGISIHFSEAMDTSSIRKHCGLLPEGSLRIEWNEGMRQFRVFPEEMAQGEVYSLYVRDACKDLEGNLLEEWAFLTFTPDSTLPQGYVTGYVRDGGQATTMVALADRLLRIVRVAVVSDSFYRIDWLKPDGYIILAGVDSDDDRRFDLLAHDEVTIGDGGVVQDLSLDKMTERWRIFERLERIFRGN